MQQFFGGKTIKSQYLQQNNRFERLVFTVLLLTRWLQNPEKTGTD
jgi:hypothetical protein